MSDLPYHQQQLEWLCRFVESRPAFLDPVFRFLNFFDTSYFFFVLISFIWLGFSYKWGLRLFYWLILNKMINLYLKGLIGWPRPSTEVPELGLYHPIDNGFPSGGAQTCFFLGILLIYYWKTPLARIIGIFYIALVSFSRIYLGVHYPVDVLGGWMVAALLAFLFITLEKSLEGWFQRQGERVTLILALALPALLMGFDPRPEVFYTMGSLIGVGLGTYISLKHHLFLPHPKTVGEGIVRAGIGITLLFLLVLLWPGEEKSFLMSFAIGIFMSLGATPICRLFIRRSTP